MKHLITGGDFLARHPEFKLVGRDEELKSMMSTLMRSKASSIILVGPGGAGATALVMGLQAAKEDNSSPFDIIAKRFHWLDYDELFSSGKTDEINASFQKLISILKRTPNSVLLIEDGKDFIDSARNAGCGHFVNAINSLVKNDETQVIFEVRDDDIGFVLKSHSDMKQSYTIVQLDEPVGEALSVIVKANSTSLEKHHSIKISEDAILKSIELTNRYMTKDASLSRAQPERAVTLIDRALSSYRLDAHASDTDPNHEEKYNILKKLYNDLREAEIAVIGYEEDIETQLKLEADRRANGEEEVKKSSIGNFMKLSAGSGFDSDEVKKIKDKIKVAENVIVEKTKEFEELSNEINSNLLLTEDHILQEFSRLSGIPASKLNEDEREKLKTLEDQINLKIWGQLEAVKKLSNSIKSSRIGRRNKNKPQGSFMFLGPSGVGKTEIVRVLSSILDMELLRFDMSEYMEKNAVNTLIGAPAGYEGYENGGTLTKAIKKNPRQIVLFDEIEKADPAVFNIFLQMLDAGRLTDRFGQTVSFSEAIIIMTSNIGQPELLEGLEMKNGIPTFTVPVEVRRQNALDVLTSTPGIRPEFLNRFNGRQNIVFFNHLEPEHIFKIVNRELIDMNTTYTEMGISIMVQDDVIDAFTRDHYDVRIGGRGLPGMLNSELEPYLTNKVLEDTAFTGSMVVGYNDGKFNITFQEKP